MRRCTEGCREQGYERHPLECVTEEASRFPENSRPIPKPRTPGNKGIARISSGSPESQDPGCVRGLVLKFCTRARASEPQGESRDPSLDLCETGLWCHMRAHQHPVRAKGLPLTHPCRAERHGASHPHAVEKRNQLAVRDPSRTCWDIGRHQVCGGITPTTSILDEPARHAFLCDLRNQWQNASH
jgi:hypothetical protein